MAGGARLPLADQRQITVRSDRSIISEPQPALDQARLTGGTSQFERISDVTNMVPV